MASAETKMVGGFEGREQCVIGFVRTVIGFHWMKVQQFKIIFPFNISSNSFLGRER